MQPKVCLLSLFVYVQSRYWQLDYLEIQFWIKSKEEVLVQWDCACFVCNKSELLTPGIQGPRNLDSTPLENLLPIWVLVIVEANALTWYKAAACIFWPNMRAWERWLSLEGFVTSAKKWSVEFNWHVSSCLNTSVKNLNGKELAIKIRLHLLLRTRENA